MQLAAQPTGPPPRPLTFPTAVARSDPSDPIRPTYDISQHITWLVRAHCMGHLYRYIPLPTVFLIACNRIREEDFAPFVHIGGEICHFLPHGWYGFLLNR